MQRILVAAASALGVALVVAGCGESTTATNTTVTIIKTQAAPAPAQESTPAVAHQHRAVTLPDVVGQRLDVAELHLDDLHIRYREVGGGTFGVINASNWTVCEQEPAAGAQDPGRVSLIVDREC